MGARSIKESISGCVAGRGGSEAGAALVAVIILSVALMTMAGGMYFLAAREQNMTYADNVGGQAFYYAEGGIENVLDILTYAATEPQLTAVRDDQSANGYGYLMDPDPDRRANPVDPIEMKIGRDSYTVWVDQVDAYGNHCASGCGLSLTKNSVAYLMITAEGRSAQGYRKMQQRVRLEATGFPLAMYINGDAIINGNPIAVNQSLYVNGNFYGRDKLDISGGDLVYGGNAGVKATGVIYAKEIGGTSAIYHPDGSPSGYWSENNSSDRDSRGPSGDSFTFTELQNTVNIAGLSQTQLDKLKAKAQNEGYYRRATGAFTLSQSELPSRDGDIVVFIEFPQGSPEINRVSLRAEWPHSPYTTGKAVIVIFNGSLAMEGQYVGNLVGDIYCPDGSVTANGSGSGTFTGTVWAKGLIDIGNFPFYMTEAFLEDPPLLAWNVVREAGWMEVDQ